MRNVVRGVEEEAGAGAGAGAKNGVITVTVPVMVMMMMIGRKEGGDGGGEVVAGVLDQGVVVMKIGVDINHTENGNKEGVLAMMRTTREGEEERPRHCGEQDAIALALILLVQDRVCGEEIVASTGILID